MEHAQALESHAVDLYLLGELNEVETDAFEDHYFECALCAEDVRVGMNFLDGGRTMMREEKAAAATNVVPIAARRRVNAWMPIAIAAMLVIVIGAPIVLRKAETPLGEIGRGHTIDLSGSRGTEADDTVTVKDGQALVLYAEIPPERRFLRYEVRVLDSKGKVLYSRPVTPEEANDPLPVILNSRIGAGTYELVVIGTEPAGQQTDVGRARFIVKRPGSNVLRRERWNSHTTQVRWARAA